CDRPGGLLERRGQLRDRGDVHAVDRRDDVVRAQAVAHGGAVRTDARDQHAASAVETRVARIECHELRAVEPAQAPRLLVGARARRGRGLVGRADANLDVHRPAVPHVRERHGFTEPDEADGVTQLRSVRDLLAVHGDDDIADLDAGLLGRRTGLHFADEGPAIDAEAERLGQSWQHVLNTDADAAALHLAVLEELVDDLADHVARYREADTDIAPRGRQDRAVDALQRAVESDQRAAGVTGIDRCVGLNEVLVALDVDAAAAEGADDAGRRGLTETERIADGDDEVADVEIVGVAELELAQPFGLDLEQRDVGRRVAADHLGLELAPV